MIYYISNKGNDRADGLTPETAWRTTEALSRRIVGGDTVLLRCGDVFYGKILLPNGIDTTHRTVLSSYGEGEKPKICLYKIVESEDAWELIAPLIWRVDLTNTSLYTGNVYTEDTNVGFLYLNGEIHGDKCFSLADLRNYWQFYCEEQYVYVCSNRNPNTYADKIFFAVDNGICLGNHCQIHGIDVYGGGCHGISGGVWDAVISQCDIHDFGGSHLLSDQRLHVRFGNGIEFWPGGGDITVERNRIYNIYDVGVTMQGFPIPGKGWKNIVFDNNIFWGNEQTFEIWTNNKEGGDGIRDCAFRNNRCLDAGRGWSHEVRPDKDAGVHLLLYATLCEKHEVVVENNIFADPRTALYYKSFEEPDGKFPADYITRRNRLYLRKDAYLVNRSYVYRAADFEVFTKECQKEIDSRIYWITESDEPMQSERSTVSEGWNGGV